MSEIITIFSGLAEHLNSAVNMLLIIIAGMMIGIWKVTQVITRFTTIWELKGKDVDSLKARWDRDIPAIKSCLESLDKRLGALEKRVGALEKRVGALEKRVEALEKRVGALEHRMESLERRVGRLEEHVNLIFDNLYPQSTASHAKSPRVLTGVGKDIVDAINAQAFLKDHQAELKAIVEDTHPRTPYDLQQACFGIVDNKLADLMPLEMLDEAKRQAFKYGIPLDNALTVVAILLRDEMFRERGWLLSGNDHTPVPRKS